MRAAQDAADRDHAVEATSIDNSTTDDTNQATNAARSDGGRSHDVAPSSRMDRAAVPLAWFGLAASIGTVVIHFALGLGLEGILDYSFLTATMCGSLAIVVLVGLPRQPGNRSLHVAAIAILFMGLELGGQVVALPLVALDSGTPVVPMTTSGMAPADLPMAAAIASWFTAWAWLPGMFLITSLMFVRFPDGEAAVRGTRVIEAVTVAGMVLVTIPMAIEWLPGSTTPYDTEATAPGWEWAVTLGFPLLLAGVVATVASLVWRSRHADGDLRHQLRWVALPVSIAAVVFVPLLVMGPALLPWVALVMGPAVIVGYGMAVLRFRLYDVDVVINRALVVAGLATIITAVDMTIVVGIGTLVGDTASTSLAIAATAIVAVLFEPLRSRVQHAANVVVYGQRATPYEVLAGMTRQEDQSDDERLAAAVGMLGEGTGAARVDVVSVDRDGTGWTWPPPDHGYEGRGLDVPARRPPDARHLDRTHPDIVRPLVHDDRTIGTVAVTKQRGEPLSPTDTRLVEEFAGQAAVLLANAMLTRQLQQRLDELAASRRRMLAAQSDARQHIEREVHDGAQQNLVALKVKLGLVKRLARSEGVGDVADLVAGVAEDADAAVASLRDLARGIYPPLLEAEGLEVALAAQAARGELPVAVTASDVGRHPREVEAAIYFCVLEALQNAAKHAGATSAEVVLQGSDGMVGFEVRDDGEGFDVPSVGTGTGLEGMRDRFATIDGTLAVVSTPGRGTVVTGWVPTIDTAVTPAHDEPPGVHRAAQAEQRPSATTSPRPTAATR